MVPVVIHAHLPSMRQHYNLPGKDAFNLLVKYVITITVINPNIRLMLGKK